MDEDGIYDQKEVQNCVKGRVLQAKFKCKRKDNIQEKTRGETLTCWDKLEKDEGGNYNQEEVIDCYDETKAKQGIVKVYGVYVTKRLLKKKLSNSCKVNRTKLKRKTVVKN